MLYERMSTLFAVLSLSAATATGIIVILAIVQRLTHASVTTRFFAELQPVSLWIGWFVAAVTMSGSLYYSLVQHLHPCPLCWLQRVCVYPFAVVLLIAAIKKDTKIWRYVMPMAIIGVVVAAYHTQLQAFPDQKGFCNLVDPCNNREVWKFGFVSLPFMDLIALLFIITLTLAATVERAEPEEVDA